MLGGGQDSEIPRRHHLVGVHVVALRSCGGPRLTRNRDSSPAAPAHVLTWPRARGINEVMRRKVYIETTVPSFYRESRPVACRTWAVRIGSIVFSYLSRSRW